MQCRRISGRLPAVITSGNDTMLVWVAWRRYVLYQVTISAVQYCSFQNLLVQYFNIFAVIIGWPLLHNGQHPVCSCQFVACSFSWFVPLEMDHISSTCDDDNDKYVTALKLNSTAAVVVFWFSQQLTLHAKQCTVMCCTSYRHSRHKHHSYANTDEFYTQLKTNWLHQKYKFVL